MEAESVIGLLPGFLLSVPMSHTDTYLHHIQVRGRDCSPSRSSTSGGIGQVLLCCGCAFPYVSLSVFAGSPGSVRPLPICSHTRMQVLGDTDRGGCRGSSSSSWSSKSRQVQ